MFRPEDQVIAMEQIEEQKTLETGTGKVLIRFLKRNPVVMIGSAVIVVAVLAAILAP